MGAFAIIGAVMMGMAALSLVALAVDTAFRHGGEGALIGLALAAVAIAPAAVCANLYGIAGPTIILWAAWYAAGLIALLMVFGAILLVHGEQGGIICLGIGLVLGAGVYALAPRFTATQATAPARTAPA